MSTNLRKQMESYSDERILNNIKQQEFFGEETIAMAKEIALERNLLNSENINEIDQAVENAAKLKAAKPYEPRDLGAGLGVAGGLFLVYFLFKMIIRMMNN